MKTKTNQGQVVQAVNERVYAKTERTKENVVPVNYKTKE
jgi:phage tail protein X